MDLTEEIEKEIDQFVENCFDSELTIYQALQFENALCCFSLHFEMEENDDVTQLVMQKYFERLEKERELQFYEESEGIR